MIAEDLVAREPWEPANIERFRSALVLLGEPDPDSVIADRLSGDSPFTSTDLTLDFSFKELAEPTRRRPRGPPGPAHRPREHPRRRGEVGRRGGQRHLRDRPERDLRRDGGGRGGRGCPEAVPAALAGLERVFEGFREEAVRTGHQGAAQQYRAALALREAGDIEGAIRSLEQVVRSPRYRFKAAAELARIHRDLGRIPESIEWFERAAESAPAGTDESRDLLYDLGVLLAGAGETERALAVFLELQADSPDYRDVALQVGRLSQKS